MTSVASGASSGARRWLGTLRYLTLLSGAMAAGPLLQTLLGLVDYLMCGPLGDVAVAGVGLGATLFLLIDTILAGFAFGIQVQVAAERGDGLDGRRALRLGCTLLPAASIALALGACALAPRLFAAQASSTAVAEVAWEYFIGRAWGIPALALLLGCRGYWFGMERPQTYVRILGYSQLSNVLFNWLLIYGELGFPRLGAAGAGWGTSLSVAVAALVSLIALRRELRSERAARGALGGVLRGALPSIAFGLLGLPGLGPTLLWILGAVGESAVAAGAILFQTTLVFALIGQGFGLAAATLVSEALGRGSVSDARLQMQRLIGAVTLTMGVAGVALAACARPLLGAFLTDPGILDEATAALRMLGLLAPALTLGLILLFALLATRYAARAAATPFVFLWMLAVPTVAWLALAGRIQLLGVFAIVVGGFLGQTAVLAAWWRAGGWAPDAVATTEARSA